MLSEIVKQDGNDGRGSDFIFDAVDDGVPLRVERPEDTAFGVIIGTALVLLDRDIGFGDTDDCPGRKKLVMEAPVAEK